MKSKESLAVSPAGSPFVDRSAELAATLLEEMQSLVPTLRIGESSVVSPFRGNAVNNSAALTIRSTASHRRAQFRDYYDDFLRASSDVSAQMAELNLESHKAPSNKQKPSLMTLPPELRLEIFEYLVHPGEVYIRFRPKVANHDVRFSHILDEWDAETPRPINYLPLSIPKKPKARKQPPQAPTSAQTQLFLVSKQLRDEAMHHYLTMNTFYIMGSDCALPYLS